MASMLLNINGPPLIEGPLIEAQRSLPMPPTVKSTRVPFAVASAIAANMGGHALTGEGSQPVKRHGNQVYAVRCPVHGGDSPSLEIWNGFQPDQLGAECVAYKCARPDVLAELAKLGHNVGTELPTTEKQFLETELDKSAKSEARRNGQTEPVGKIEIYKHWYQDTSTADGERLIERHADNLLIVWNEKNDARLFHVDGTSGVWLEDSQSLQEALIATALDWTAGLNAAVMGGKLSATEQKRIQDAARRCTRPGGRNEIVSSIPGAYREVKKTGLPPGLTECKQPELDSHRQYIGAPNGVIDLGTGLLVQNDKLRRSALVTKMLPDPFDGEAEHPIADLLFAHPMTTPEEQAYVVAIFGFALRGNPMRSKGLYAFYDDSGDGDSGKSTLFKAVAASLGAYAGEFSRDALMGTAKNNAGRATPEREPFAKHRVVYCEEAAKIDSDNSIVKMLTGAPSVTFRMLHEDPQTLPITATTFVNLNGQPDFDLTDGALLNRYVPVHYPTIPKAKQSAHLDELLTVLHEAGAREFRQAIVAKLVRACAENEAPPTMPPSIEADKRRHFLDRIGDDGQFALAAMERGKPIEEVSTNALWELWIEHSKEDGDNRYARRQFTTKVSKLLVKATQRGGNRYWQGYKLATLEKVRERLESGESTKEDIKSPNLLPPAMEQMKDEGASDTEIRDLVDEELLKLETRGGDPTATMNLILICKCHYCPQCDSPVEESTDKAKLCALCAQGLCEREKAKDEPLQGQTPLDLPTMGGKSH